MYEYEIYNKETNETDIIFGRPYDVKIPDGFTVVLAIYID